MERKLNGNTSLHKSVIDSNRYMLNTGKASDVTFLVGEMKVKQQEFRVHKYILASRSEVFYRMLYGKMAEHTKRSIEIPDISPEVFQLLLNFMYCDERNIPDELIYLVAYGADKYDLKFLLQRCWERMRVTLNVNNVFQTLSFAKTHFNDTTIEACLEYIYLHTKEVFESDSFLSIPHDCLEYVMNVHRLNLHETEIFEYLVKWAQWECQNQGIQDTDGSKLKKVLGEKCIKSINFLQMTEYYFKNIVLRKYPRLLTESQKSDILQFLCSDKVVAPEPDIPKRLIVKRFMSTNAGKGYKRGNEDSLYIQLSENVILHTVYLYGSCAGEGYYQLDICVKDINNVIIARKTRVELKTDCSVKEYPVTFFSSTLPQNEKVAVTLKRNETYAICVKMSGPSSYYGTGGREEMSVEGTMIQFSTNVNGLNGTTVERGQIAILVFEKVNANMLTHQ